MDQYGASKGLEADGDPPVAEVGSPKEAVVRDGTQPQGSADTSTAHRAWERPASTVLTLQDLKDLPGQLLPEETQIHLRNAGREAALALVSLVKNINKARQNSAEGKVRRRIDVE